VDRSRSCTLNSARRALRGHDAAFSLVCRCQAHCPEGLITEPGTKPLPQPGGLRCRSESAHTRGNQRTHGYPHWAFDAWPTAASAHGCPRSTMPTRAAHTPSMQARPIRTSLRSHADCFAGPSRGRIAEAHATMVQDAGTERQARVRYFARVYVISIDLNSSPPGTVSYISKTTSSLLTSRATDLTTLSFWPVIGSSILP
jgi:hypothetical protein